MSLVLAEKVVHGHGEKENSLGEGKKQTVVAQARKELSASNPLEIVTLRYTKVFNTVVHSWPTLI